MSWLIEREPEQRELAERFRELITGESVLQIPGAHDGMAARIAKRSGFQALYLSGAAYTASRGLPDLGLVYSLELADRVRELVRATGLPVLADIDTGFGGILNAARAAKEMVEAKAAAVQIEDQEMPKKCGHLNGKKLVSPEEMAQKIRAIKEASPSLLVIARTDARSVEGLEEAVSRARLYLEAGADGIFPEALEGEAEFRRFGEAVSCPLLANMTEFGRTPYYTAEQFQSWGFKMVIYPVTSLRVAAKAYERVYGEMKRNGSQAAMLGEMQTRKELYETIRYEEYEAMDQRIAKTKLPDPE
ncbi:methylisocitrate lyase [Paenibacillus soyae]|uniref:Methylisocitrate lyase n=1 Tax=Paenibacillus soyae TaxID=2969249 RepID=A0A9X2SAP1_9BACL|nr:methylisocitrate lyase [Paenibacillus soyae]MCR2803842.1 methylisocitrate lyase [Paenibacillus soyae]